MEPQAFSAHITGESMKPWILEGDLVQLSARPVSVPELGKIYRFKHPNFQRLVAHRLVKIEGNNLFFQGDHQPHCEIVPLSEPLHEVVRILERRSAPTAESLLFSLLCLDPGKAAIPNSTEKWPWKSIVDLALRHRLSPYLFYSLKQLKIFEKIPLRERDALTSDWYSSLQRSELIENTLDSLKGLPLSFFKGASLRSRFYPLPHLRVMDDIDCLVEPKNFAAVLEELQSRGFHWSEENRKISTFYPHTTLKSVGTGICVDLHSELFQPDRYSFPLHPIPWPENSAFELIYLSTHAFLHWGRHGQSLFDIYLLFKRAEINLEECKELATKYQCLTPFLFGQMQLEKWFNLPLENNLWSNIPWSIRLRLWTIDKFYGDDMAGELFGAKKKILQMLLADSLPQFYRLWKSPARRKMFEV